MLVDSKHYVSINQLMKQFNVSQRTIYYEIENINYWLKRQGLEKIRHKRLYGFYLVEFPKKLLSISEFPYEYSIEERLSWIALHLLISEERLLLKNFQKWLDVSRNTILNDIKKLKTHFEEYNLRLIFDRKSGYVLVGCEEDKRRLKIYYLSSFLNGDVNRKEFLQKIAEILSLPFIELTPIFNMVHKCEEYLKVHYADKDLFLLAIQMYLNIRRIKKGKIIVLNDIEKQVIKDTYEYQSVLQFLHLLEDAYEINFPQDEICYLTVNLLGIKLQHRYKLNTNSPTQTALKKAIINMINDFELYAGVKFEEREYLENNLLAHLQPAFYRSIYGIEIKNPLTNVIKEKYNDIYIITEKVVHHFEKLTKNKLRDNEIAYISIHFGGCLRSREITIGRKQALIICNSGVGTSEILRKQLEYLFPMVTFKKTLSAREYEKGNRWGDVSFAVSTVEVRKKDHPLFVVQPILTKKDKSVLAREIYSKVDLGTQPINEYSLDDIVHIVKKHADLKSEKGLEAELLRYFQKEHSLIKSTQPSLMTLLKNNIQVKKCISNWKEAIRVASQPLLDKGHIRQHYIDKMISILEDKGPYVIISPGIALPHATPEDGVISVGMSMLLLKEPVFFLEDTENKINIIIILAPTKQNTHIRAMSELNNFLSKKSNLTKLRNAQTYEDVREYMKKVQQKERDHL